MSDVTASAPAEPAPVPRYLSCRHIERGLVFYPGKITACCANPATGLTPTIAPFSTDLTAEAIVEGRERITARHKAGDIVPECVGCPRLEELDWGVHNCGPYPIDEVTIAHFSSCNIRCNYCYTVTAPELKAPLSKAPRMLKLFEQLIARKLLAPNSTVRFSGGEPTLSPEFEAVLSLLTNFGVRTIVYTNAVTRSDAIVDALKQDKVELILGIDAATIAVYKAIKKMNYNEKVWRTVAEYCAARRPDAVNKVWAKFIFTIENYHEAAHFVRRAHEAGAKHVYYDFDASRVRPGESRGGIGLPEEAIEHTAVLCHECEKRGIEVAFAQAGMAFLTPERQGRLDRELQRLRLQELAIPA